MKARALTQGEHALVAALERAPGTAATAAGLRAVGLPNRRVEAWRWSDLSAALTDDVALPAVTGVAIDSEDTIERLAAAFGRFEAITVGAGETLMLDDRLGADGALDVRARRIEVGAGGVLVRTLAQEPGAIALDRIEVTLGEGAQLRQTTLAFGAKLARLETRVTIKGEGARVQLSSVALTGAGRHADLTSRIDHQAPHGEVLQIAKSIARGGGRAVFQGEFRVERAAQKTDARMRHDALLLDDKGEINAKPELKIFADDVRCAHGATVGALDPAALFYLRQRGLPEAQAQALLLEAFVAEAFDALPEDRREAMAARAKRWLEDRA